MQPMPLLELKIIIKGVVRKYRSRVSATVVVILGRLWFASGYVTVCNIIVIRKST